MSNVYMYSNSGTSEQGTLLGQFILIFNLSFIERLSSFRGFQCIQTKGEY